MKSDHLPRQARDKRKMKTHNERPFPLILQGSIRACSIERLTCRSLPGLGSSCRRQRCRRVDCSATASRLEARRKITSMRRRRLTFAWGSSCSRRRRCICWCRANEAMVVWCKLKYGALYQGWLALDGAEPMPEPPRCSRRASNPSPAACVPPAGAVSAAAMVSLADWRLRPSCSKGA